MTASEQRCIELQRVLAAIIGNPDGKSYLAEDAPRALIVNIHRALDRAVPRVDPAAKETP